MKTYKTWEVIKMLEENPTLEFENKDSLGHTIMKVDKTINYLKVEFKGENVGSVGFDENIRLNQKWTLVQKPVTWDEVLRSDKFIKVEHQLTEKRSNLRKFNGFKDMFEMLSDSFNGDEIKTILSEAKFYLQEEE